MVIRCHLPHHPVALLYYIYNCLCLSKVNALEGKWAKLWHLIFKLLLRFVKNYRRNMVLSDYQKKSTGFPEECNCCSAFSWGTFRKFYCIDFVLLLRYSKLVLTAFETEIWLIKFLKVPEFFHVDENCIYWLVHLKERLIKLSHIMRKPVYAL